jgi:hypothetical protein
MSEERTLSDLTRDLAGNISDLFRNEIRLARAEMVDHAKALASGLAELALAFVIGGAAVTLALVALAAALSMVAPMWASALIAAIVGGVIAYLLFRAGREALSAQTFTLPRTTRSVSRDIDIIKDKKEKVSP